MATLARAIATAGGLGRAPAAPGTVASAASVLAGAAMGRGALAGGALAATLAGIAALHRLPDAVDDPPQVVIDEVAGQFVAMLGLPEGRRSARGLLAAFALFRVFDIAKPGPVGWADRRSGPVAVMADDLVAGALAAFVLRACRRWLG
jgi:phosphatidylglycerophosphatase A